MMQLCLPRAYRRPNRFLMRTKLTPSFIAKAKADLGAERTIYWDETMPGFGLVVTAGGHRSFVVQYRISSRSRRLALKRGLKLAEARKEAHAVLGAVAKGYDPLAERRKAEAAAGSTVRTIAEEYLTREAKHLRSIEQRRAILERLIYPKFGSRQITDVRRGEIVRLLDRIEDQNGPVMADQALAALRRLMTWHAGRSDEFRSPIVRGMTRTKPKERARQRVLSDDELRAVWKTAEAMQNPFGHLVRFILLTAARRNEAARMRREELSGNDWLIPAARHKSKRDFLLPLSATALALLKSVPIIGRHKDNGHIFTGDGRRPIGGFSKFKRNFDERCGVTGWTLHDLRRTARTLMSRAGIAPDHAERACGHVIPGIRGTYDVHGYYDEKGRAFEALAVQIERIVNPQENVVSLRAAQRRSEIALE
jgi:integrase